MTRVGLCGALVLAGASMMAAQAAAPQRARVASPSPQAFHPPQTFQKYCFECHGGTKRKGDVSIERLIRQSAQSSVGGYWDEWNKIAEMLETRQMPSPDEAELFPTDDERAAAVAWIRETLGTYEAEHAGDPGTSDGPATDQRRVRLCASRSDRHRRQGRRRCVERLGRRRGLHELRRRAVRRGHEHRAVSRSREAGGRPRRDWRRTAGVLRATPARRAWSCPR